MRIPDHGLLIAAAGAVLAIACSCPSAKEPAPNPSPAPPAADEPAPPADNLVPQVAEFADQACRCQDKACVDEVNRAFNEWAAAHKDAQGTSEQSGDIAAQVARMAACSDRFAAAELPLQGQPCTEAGECAEGLTCLKYYGIAGPRGPQFTSCEIPCGPKGQCPDGQSCRTIADGPGRVCRPQ